MNNHIRTSAVGRFSPASLATIGITLIVAGGVLSYAFRSRIATKKTVADSSAVARKNADVAPAEMPAWGELIATDIDLETPEEYLAFELRNIRPPEWQFPGMTPDQVSSLMTASGLTAEQIKRSFLPTMASSTSTGTVIHPDDDLVFSLSPDVRRKFYRELGRLPGNDLMQFPYVFPGTTGERCLRRNKLGRTVNGMIKKLLYTRGDTQCLSDVNTVMQHLSGPSEQLKLLKVLSRQPAVEASLRIRPGADVDKIIGYWGKGTKVKDVRPLLESMARQPEGGTLSLLHLLPTFARQRLDTFPMPPQPGDPNMDCHWSSLNFFNETPDNRLGDPKTAVAYIQANYYRIAEPTSYGDIIAFVDEKGHGIHSALYLADDLVFTKNGSNMAQPWKLARLKSLIAYYALDTPTQVLVWRKKDT